MPSKVIIIVTEFMFLSINIFWALLRAHFNPRLTARAKMSLSRAQNIFMPANINSIVLLYGIKSTEKMTFVRVYFRALKRKPVIRKSDSAVRFSRFLVPSRQRNHRKSFCCHGKYFAKENFRAPAWTSARGCCGNKTGNPERAVSLHLARSGNQSQREIWFILPARGACHIINVVIVHRPTLIQAF